MQCSERSQEEHVEDKIKGYRPEVEECGERPPWLIANVRPEKGNCEGRVCTYLHVRKRGLETEVQLQRGNQLTLLQTILSSMCVLYLMDRNHSPPRD